MEKKESVDHEKVQSQYRHKAIHIILTKTLVTEDREREGIIDIPFSNFEFNGGYKAAYLSSKLNAKDIPFLTNDCICMIAFKILFTGI